MCAIPAAQWGKQNAVDLSAGTGGRGERINGSCGGPLQYGPNPISAGSPCRSMPPRPFLSLDLINMHTQRGKLVGKLSLFCQNLPALIDDRDSSSLLQPLNQNGRRSGSFHVQLVCE